jgi:hypothetical protein
MMKSKLALSTVLGAALVCSGIAIAQKPVEDVSGRRHPNIAAAQRHSQQAGEKVSAASQRMGMATRLRPRTCWTRPIKS